MIGDHPGYEKDGHDGDNRQREDNGEPFQSLHEMELILLAGERKKARQSNHSNVSAPTEGVHGAISHRLHSHDWIHAVWCVCSRGVIPF
jgi:hypothetical protein